MKKKRLKKLKKGPRANVNRETSELNTAEAAPPLGEQHLGHEEGLAVAGAPLDVPHDVVLHPQRDVIALKGAIP